MPAIDALQNLQRDLIRKALNGSVFRSPVSADTIDENDLFDATTGDLKPTGLPSGYDDLGYTTDAGAQFARAVTESTVSSWQSVSPTRSDNTADTTTLQLACQETKLATIGLYTGADESLITPAVNGVVRIDKPATPTARYYRLLSIAVDETDVGEIVIARYLPNAKVTSFDNQNFGKGDDPVLWPVTFTGFVDDVLGFSESYLFGGAGWLARLAAMGFTPAAASIPVITSVSDRTLGTAGGELITIHGSHFTGTTGITFAGTAATSFTVLDDATIVATAPAHAAGTGALVVTNATGPSTTGGTVTYA